MTIFERTVAGDQIRILTGDIDEDVFAAFCACETIFGLDVETTAVDDTGPRFFGLDVRVRLVQVATVDRAVVLNPTIDTQRQMIVSLLGDESKYFVTHTNFDVLAVWAAFGIALGQRAIDTHLLACLLDPGETADHTLKTLTERHIDSGLRQAETALHEHFRRLAPPGWRAGQKLLAYGFTHVAVDAEPYLVYAGLDAIYVRRLLDVLLPQLADLGQLPRMEMWLAAQTTAITIRGLRLDLDYTKALTREFEDRHTAARLALEELMGFKATSPRRIGWLADRGVEFVYTTATGAPSLSSKDALPDLLARYPDGQVGRMLRLTLELAETQNFANNLKKLPRFADAGGRVHPDIKTLAAHTGRMSVKNPPMQTFKKTDPRLRRCFVAEPDHVLVGCDFANVELRLAAALSQDPNLMNVFQTGQDAHDNTARMLFGDQFTPDQRKIAKALNFGTVYGGGATGLARQAHLPLDTARAAVATFRQAYPGIARFSQTLARRAVVVNPARRCIPTDPQRTYANANYAIQSCARDLFVEAVYRACVTEGLHDALWMLIHDEIVLQVPEAQAEQATCALRRAMTTGFHGVPITADAEIIGPRWGGPLPDEATPSAAASRS